MYLLCHESGKHAKNTLTVLSLINTYNMFYLCTVHNHSLKLSYIKNQKAASEDRVSHAVRVDKCVHWYSVHRQQISHLRVKILLQA